MTQTTFTLRFLESTVDVVESMRTHDLYVNWLADYLYRPEQSAVRLAELSLAKAWPRIPALESTIAFGLWDHPMIHFVPDSLDPEPRNMDYPHRAELSHVLSRVSDRMDRVNLLDRFYQAFAVDPAK